MTNLGRSLEEVEQDRPYPEYSDWWEVGSTLVRFLASALVPEWKQVCHGEGRLADVEAFVRDYVTISYGRSARPDLVKEFVSAAGSRPLFSGEFDALSYAFFRAAFEQLAMDNEGGDEKLAQARRQFSRAVGAAFFDQIADYESVQLPSQVTDESSFEMLQNAVAQVGAFLSEQKYLRDHFAFKFDVDIVWRETRLRQPADEFVHRLHDEGVAYAVYEMGYPVILPSAAYLYNTVGEAQHHSSRIIEELCKRSGLQAAETSDFDPTKYEATMVVELWEVRPASSA